MPDDKNSYYILPLLVRKASAPVCKKRKASVTVEAALAVPLFFLAVVSLLYLMEVSVIRTSIRAGLQSAGKKLMQDASEVTFLLPSTLENELVYSIGVERLERSMIEDGSAGLHCEESSLSSVTGIGTLKVKYKVRIPIPVFGSPTISCEESMRIKTWTGYEKSILGNVNNDIVYVAETGIVYHKDYHCTHLELSIRTVPEAEITVLRNQSGGKYYPCRFCQGAESGKVYITENGDRYHSSLSCSGLKRTIYAVPVSEAVGKRACSRCGE